MLLLLVLVCERAMELAVQGMCERTGTSYVVGFGVARKGGMQSCEYRAPTFLLLQTSLQTKAGSKHVHVCRYAGS